MRIVLAMEACEGPNIEDRSGRLVATIGHLFEDMMATCCHLDIAGRVTGTSSYTQRAFRRLRKKYGVELQQDDLGIVFMTIRYPDKLWHPQFFGAITFVSQRLTVVFWFVEAGTRVHGPCRGSGQSFGFQEGLWSGEEGPRFAPDAIVPVSGPTGLQRRILRDGLSYFHWDRIFARR